MIKSYKYKLKLNKTQEETFNRWLGACRIIYNLAKEVSEDTYKKTGKTLTGYNLQAQVIDLKKDYKWMRELPKDMLAEPAFRYYESLKSFFRGEGRPKWAKKDKYNTLVFTQQNEKRLSDLRIKGDKVHLQKIGWVKFFNSRQINGRIKQILITKKYNGWYMVIKAEVNHNPLPQNSNHIGIDVGIDHLVITSDGEFINNLNIYRKRERELRLLNRSFCRKQKGSKAWAKSKRKLQKFHSKTQNIRNDYLHKITTQLVNENQVITVEDLQINNMSKNKYLAKSINDAAWSIMIFMLEYKSNWYGRTFQKVSPRYTSRDCSICGYRTDKMPLSIREWTCPKCKTSHNRDINAAENIKQRGGQLLASQTWFSRTSVEAEPIEFIRGECQVTNPLASR